LYVTQNKDELEEATMARYDTVITGGTVIDGRMVPRRRADIAIKDGKIAKVGRVDASDADRVLDATGLIVAPGFIDLHTHYDSTFFWDPYCTLSGWHGVTSVVIGNCGFGFAPAHQKDQDYLMRSLNRVEAIPYDCMKETMTWTWESFLEWMDTIEAMPKGVNMLTYVPLNPLLIYVMGLEAAKSRDATDEELERMKAILREALDAGACGFSAQRTPPGSGADAQRDHDGTPFATDLMSNRTMVALAEVLAHYDHAFIQQVLFSGDLDADRHHIEELTAASKSPLLYNVVATDSRQPNMHKEMFAWMRDCRTRGMDVYPVCLTSAAPFIFTLEDWNLFDDSELWRDILMGTTEERLAKLKAAAADPVQRQRLRDNPPQFLQLEAVIMLSTKSEKFRPAKGMLLVDGAPKVGYDNLTDMFIDISIEDELTTLFQVPQLNDDASMVPDLVIEPFGIWGVSDGGAHQKFLTAGSFTTESIIKWVREEELVTLEEAHYRLSSLPAHCAGFKDRGTLVEGAPADIIVYDYENLTLLESEVAHDLPGGEWRRIQKAEGYRWTIVNGVITFEDGKCTDETPGMLLRGGK
jgi:N-acyl-D-aspartate/D-glutamate deacylase